MSLHACATAITAKQVRAATATATKYDDSNSGDDTSRSRKQTNLVVVGEAVDLVDEDLKRDVLVGAVRTLDRVVQLGKRLVVVRLRSKRSYSARRQRRPQPRAPRVHDTTHT